MTAHRLVYRLFSAGSTRLHQLASKNYLTMPKVRTMDKKRRPPAGWEIIEPTLEELQAKMKEAEREPHEGKRKCESIWPIFRIHHQRSRYIYEMYYKKKAITRELYDWCLREGWADAALIAKWKKNGYESLCCLR